MTSCPSSDDCNNINLSVLTGFVEIFAAKQLAALIELTLLGMKNFLGSVVQSETALSRKMVRVVDAKMGARKKEDFTLKFAITDPPPLREAGTKPARHTLGAAFSLRKYAADDVRLRDAFSAISEEKVFSTFLNGSRSLQSIPMKKPSGNEALPNSVPTMVKDLFLFRVVEQVSRCIASG